MCDKPGHTAHDLTWDEKVNGWVCEDHETMEFTAEPPCADRDIDGRPRSVFIHRKHK